MYVCCCSICDCCCVVSLSLASLSQKPHNRLAMTVDSHTHTHTDTCTCIHTYKYTCVDKRVFTFTLGNHRKRGIWNVIYTYNERKNWRDNKLYTLLFPLLLLLRLHSCLLCVLGEFAFAVRWFSLAWNTQHTNGALAQRGVYFIFAHKIIFNLLAIPATARILLNTATHSRRSVI